MCLTKNNVPFKHALYIENNRHDIDIKHLTRQFLPFYLLAKCQVLFRFIFRRANIIFSINGTSVLFQFLLFGITELLMIYSYKSYFGVSCDKSHISVCCFLDLFTKCSYFVKISRKSSFTNGGGNIERKVNVTKFIYSVIA